MLVLVVKFSILRRSKITHVGNKGLSLGIPQSRYTKVWADPRNGDGGMRGMLPRLPSSCRCSPAQSDPSSFLNFQLVFAPAAKGADHFLRYGFVFVPGRPPGQTPLLYGALVCRHAHTGMGMDPVTGPECCASIIRSNIPTSIRPTMPVCGVNAQQDSDTVMMRTRDRTCVSYHRHQCCAVALGQQRLPARGPSTNLEPTGSVARTQPYNVLVACQLC